jgi:hypothetical protein
MPLDYLTEPRGKPVRGAAALAEYLLDDPEKVEVIYGMSPEERLEFGLIELGGQVVGFSNWLDAAVRARAGKKRPRRSSKESTAA